MTNIDQIQKHLYRYVINEIAFFEVCPISLDELIGSSRVQRTVGWRTVGMVWMRLSGMTLTQAGAMFNRNHATVSYAEVQVLDALAGFHPRLKEKFDRVLNHGQNTCVKNNDMNINLVNSLILLENDKEFRRSHK
jgi:chromosomal replication initiation ATPase DnaA